MFPSHKEVEELRKKYPANTRVELIYMDDPYNTKLQHGSRGTVICVDDIGSIHIDWDCGSSLAVAYPVDKVRIIKEENEDE